MGQNKRRTPAIPLRDQREPFAGFHRFPYFQGAAPAAASLVIGYRYGRDILVALEAFVPPAYQFPYRAGAARLNTATLLLAQRPPRTDPRRLRGRIHRIH